MLPVRRFSGARNSVTVFRNPVGRPLLALFEAAGRFAFFGLQGTISSTRHSPGKCWTRSVFRLRDNPVELRDSMGEASPPKSSRIVARCEARASRSAQCVRLGRNL